MSTQTVTSGFDTWASSTGPTTPHPRESALKVRTAAGQGFLWFRSPAPVGTTVSSAILRLRARGASTGSRTLSVYRIGESWKEGQLTWDNRPAVLPSTVVTEAIGTLADGDVVEIDVTSIAQAWAGGLSNYGVRLDTNAATTHQFYALNSAHGPELVVTWADNPSQPSDLSPAESVTSKDKPYLTFTYEDLSGNTALAAVQVQISTSTSFTSPTFDSGEVATTESGLDLATTAFAGLADGVTRYWRVRAKDGAGLWSVWSDPVSMTRQDKPDVAITNLGAGVVYDTTPPIIWSVTGGTQVRYRVLVDHVTDPDRWVYDSGVIQSAATTHTISGIRDDRTYRVRVRVWDGENREATPGDPTYREASETFFLDDDVAVGPPTDLTVTQDGFTPYVLVEFQRSTTPDSLVIIRDGAVATVDAADLFVSGTTYQYRSHYARPNWPTVYEVRAVVDGRTSASNPSVTFATKVEGLWLVDRDRQVSVTLWGDDEGTWTNDDDASVYTPINGRRVVRVVSGMRGIEGSLSGLLMAGFGKSFDAMVADLYLLKERPYQTVQLYAGDASIEVLVGNITIAPSPKTRSGQMVKRVSFDFWQVGELPFDTTL